MESVLNIVKHSELLPGLVLNKNYYYTGQESEKTQFVVHVSDTPLTFTPGHGHQTWYELADPKQGYNHAKYEHLPNT